MHDIRIRQSVADGEILWWAEDDLGLAAGAATLAELKSVIREWTDAEGVPSDEVRMELIADEPAEPAPAEPPSDQSSGSGVGADDDVRRSIVSSLALSA